MDRSITELPNGAKVERLERDNSAVSNVHRLPRLQFGDLLVAYLEQLSIDYVFGIPGGAIEPLYNALARSARRGGPRSVVARHESGAAFMADGYARHAGKLGVCCATTGPGATNLITGVAAAYANDIPMLVVTAQTALPTFGKGAFQESSCTGVNTIGMFEHCTRYNTLVSHADQFERKLAAAILTALGSPGGPVHLSVPIDLLRSRVVGAGPSYELKCLLPSASLLDEGAVNELYRQIATARKKVFVIGEGCRDGIEAVLKAALVLNASVVTTPHAKGLVSSYHPLFCGVIGFGGHISAQELLADPDVDLVVAIGTALGEWATDGWNMSRNLDQRLIHVHSEPSKLSASPMARLHVQGTIRTIFTYILKCLNANPYVGFTHNQVVGCKVVAGPSTDPHPLPTSRLLDAEDSSWCDDSVPIKPQRLLHELPRLFPPETHYLADVGASFAWAVRYLHPSDPRGTAQQKANSGGCRFWACFEFAPMGWAIGAAVGTALACPGEAVVCITGDGSLLMNGQEITVAIQEKLPVIFIVLNDAALGMVKHGQQLTGAEPVGFALPEVDYAMFAKAMGANAHTIRSPQELLALDGDAICRRAGPTLLDVRIDPEEIPPITTRIKGLST